MMVHNAGEIMLENSKTLSENDISSKKYSADFLEIKEGLISVLKQEASSLLDVANNFPDQGTTLVESILQCQGHIVFSGMGKSGLIARKIVATFSSMGLPSLFLHPAEALHGDLGTIKSQDLFIAISKSGSGDELQQIQLFLSSQRNKTVLICCKEGTLKNFDLVVTLPFKKEACELNLAPTSSSTLMLAFGDALSIVASKKRGFTKNDFAKFHPSGMLGKNLLLKVKSLMHTDDVLPLLSKNASFKDTLITITQKKLGVAVVINNDKKLLGIVTDGDLRRACNAGASVFEKKASDIMTFNPKTISPDFLAYNALVKMEDSKITSLIILENEKIVGLIHIHDLLNAGVRRR